MKAKRGHIFKTKPPKTMKIITGILSCFFGASSQYQVLAQSQLIWLLCSTPKIQIIKFMPNLTPPPKKKKQRHTVGTNFCFRYVVVWSLLNSCEKFQLGVKAA